MVALVTGANRGTGKAIVNALLAAGAARVYAGSRQPAARAGADPLITHINLDVTDSRQIAMIASQCSDVQILVNNAGIAAGQPSLATDDLGAARQEMQVNYFGMLEMCRAFAPLLSRNGGWAIINFLSIMSGQAHPPLGSSFASQYDA